MAESKWRPGDRVYWELCGNGTIERPLAPEWSGFWIVRFDDGVPVEYSTMNPCVVLEENLEPARE